MLIRLSNFLNILNCQNLTSWTFKSPKCKQNSEMTLDLPSYKSLSGVLGLTAGIEATQEGFGNESWLVKILLSRINKTTALAEKKTVPLNLFIHLILFFQMLATGSFDTVKCIYFDYIELQSFLRFCDHQNEAYSFKNYPNKSAESCNTTTFMSLQEAEAEIQRYRQTNSETEIMAPSRCQV